MLGLGFGLERIGVAALARPVLFSLILVCFSALMGAFVPGIKFNGNVTSVVSQSSETFQNYNRQKNDFRNFSRDIALIVRSPRLKTASGLEDLRTMQLDLSLANGISAVFSLFSIPDPDRQTGELLQFFPSSIENDDEATALLARLLADYPQSRSLISPDNNAALLLVALDLGIDVGDDKKAFDAFAQLKLAANEAAPDDFELHFAGLTPIGLTILHTLVNDQVRLTLIGLFLGALIAMLLFRSLVAALVCAVPPALTAIWSIGLFGLLDIPINYLTTILPTLALILAYADGIVLYHRWNRMNLRRQDGSAVDMEATLREAILRVGPASALTSITTAVAISSFVFSSSESLVQFAWIGVILVSFAFLAVVTGLPVAGYWLLNAGILKESREWAGDGLFGQIAIRLYEKSHVMISVVALMIVGALVYIHVSLTPDYRVTDYLPKNSDTLEAETLANDLFGGRSFIFFSVPVADNGNISSPDNRKRLAEVTNLLADEFRQAEVYSLHTLWSRFDEVTIAKIAAQLDAVPGKSRQGYLSKDGTRMLVSLRLPSDQSISQTGSMLDDIDAALTALPYANDIIVTGFPVLLAKEFTRMINELRASLLIAILFGIAVIGVATQSGFYALAVAVPNLFPILAIELVIYLQGGNISVTEVVALTLAFGIAIDNAVHVVNVFHFEQQRITDRPAALRAAITEIAPALGGSTLIICIATSVTLFSILPILPIIGQLIIAILVVALFTNLVILPANILTLGHVLYRHKDKN